MNVLNEVKLDFSSISANEAFARSVAACFAAQLDPTLEELGDLRTAVSEAVTNAIVHGYPNSIGRITMRLRRLEDNVLEVQIKDRGVGIPDVRRAREPMFTTGGEERSGMGFTIMESFMDNIKVTSVPGRGTSVTLRKRISRRRKHERSNP